MTIVSLDCFRGCSATPGTVRQNGILFLKEVDPSSTEGLGYFVIEDPDGNPM